MKFKVKSLQKPGTKKIIHGFTIHWATMEYFVQPFLIQSPARQPSNKTFHCYFLIQILDLENFDIIQHLSCERLTRGRNVAPNIAPIPSTIASNIFNKKLSKTLTDVLQEWIKIMRKYFHYSQFSPCNNLQNISETRVNLFSIYLYKSHNITNTSSLW